MVTSYSSLTVSAALDHAFAWDRWRPVRPPVCRRPGCTATATDDRLRLCERHRAELPTPPPNAHNTRATEQQRRHSDLHDAAWRALAACRDKPSAWWFPSVDESRGKPGAYDTARAICASCEVRAQCLSAGMDEAHGMWGGLSPKERRRLRSAA